MILMDILPISLFSYEKKIIETFSDDNMIDWRILLLY
jgi:hypothetical protein